MMNYQELVFHSALRRSCFKVSSVSSVVKKFPPAKITRFTRQPETGGAKRIGFKEESGTY
jgi:hypothetical protein